MSSGHVNTTTHMHSQQLWIPLSRLNTVKWVLTFPTVFLITNPVNPPPTSEIRSYYVVKVGLGLENFLIHPLPLGVRFTDLSPIDSLISFHFSENLD